MTKETAQKGDYCIFTDNCRDVYYGRLISYDRLLQHAVIGESRKMWRFYAKGRGLFDVAVNGIDEKRENKIDTPVKIHELGFVHSVIPLTAKAKKSLDNCDG